jgi:FG-GAP repeat
MKRHFALTALLAGFACLLLAGCQAKDDEIIEDVFASLLKLSVSEPADGENFAYTLSLDGDYALIGAPGAGVALTDSGEAHLFLKSQGGLDAWGHIKTLVAEDAGANDYFGSSVSISGDYAVIGAGGENGSGTDRGAAYVFYRNQGGADNWGQVKKLVSGDTADDDGFGYAVAIDGTTIIVGADGEDGSGTDQGAAYIFYKDQGGVDDWGQVAKIVSGDPDNVNQFGYALTLKGAYALVGSPREDGTGADRGAAYLFSRDLGGADAWGLVKKVVPSDPTDDAWFATALAIDGTLAVVGSGWDDAGGTNRGSAYVFGRDHGGTDNWGQIKKLTASDGRDSDLFGYSVAIDGTSVVVGAGWANAGGTERGQAYIFTRDEGGVDNWGEVQRLRASDAANEDWFGFSTAIFGSYILVGAVGEDGAGSARGAAYLFKKI